MVERPVKMSRKFAKNDDLFKWDAVD